MAAKHTVSDVTVVLLGTTQSGKSASGNTILGGDRDTFKENFSPASVTKNCQSAQKHVNGQEITVIDTIGLSDTTTGNENLHKNIGQIFDYTEGVDVFLLVIKLGNEFSSDKQNAVKLIQTSLGAKACKHTLVLLTHGDLLHGPVEKYLSKSETLRSVVDQCSGGCHVFNNKDNDRGQVTELLKKIEKLRMMNRYNRYTKQDYENQSKSFWKEHWEKFTTTATVITGAGAGAVIAGTGAAAVIAVAGAATIGLLLKKLL